MTRKPPRACLRQASCATSATRRSRVPQLAHRRWTFGGTGDAIAFQTERRLYSGGHEEILVAEVARRAGRGWLRVEVPLRSWRLSTLAPAAGDLGSPGGDRYRPRLDCPALLLLADDGGAAPGRRASLGLRATTWWPNCATAGASGPFSASGRPTGCVDGRHCRRQRRVLRARDSSSGSGAPRRSRGF